MKRKIWINKVKFSDSEKIEREYYFSLTPEEKLHILQELRERIDKIRHESRKGLRRVFRVIK